MSDVLPGDAGYVFAAYVVFLALLLKCQKQVKPRGGVMVLCELNDLARDLLHTTALDTLWPIYDTLSEALESIGA